MRKLLISFLLAVSLGGFAQPHIFEAPFLIVGLTNGIHTDSVLVISNDTIYWTSFADLSFWVRFQGHLNPKTTTDSVIVGSNTPVDLFTVDGTSYLNGNTRVEGKLSVNVAPGSNTFAVGLNDNLFSTISSSNSASSTWFTVSNNVANSIGLQVYGSTNPGVKWGQTRSSNVYIDATGDFNIGTSNTGDMRFYTYSTYRYQWDQNGRWYIDSIPLRWDFATYVNRSRYVVWDTVTDQVLSVPFDTLQAYLIDLDTLVDGFGIKTFSYDGLANDTVVVDTTEVATLYALGDSLSNIGINNLTDGKTGGNSVFLGTGAGTNDDATDNQNVAVGDSTLTLNTSGNCNTANGYWALHSNTTGSYNTGIGYMSLRLNNTGAYNTSIGYRSMYNHTCAHFNVAVGFDALYNNTTGSYNTGIGREANYFNQTGHYNTMVGSEAGRGAGYHNKTGCVFIGYQAGYTEHGSNKLYIENSASLFPLIYGEFDNNFVKINGAFETTGNATIANNFYITGSDHYMDFETTKYFKIYRPNHSFLIDWQTGSRYLKYTNLGIDFFLDDSGMGLDNYSSVQVNTIETTLTNDNTHLPTSGAVHTAITNGTLTEEEVQDYAWNTLGGTQALIGVTYQDATNDVDFVVEDDLSLFDNVTSAFITTGGETDPLALLTAGTDNVKDTHIDWGTGADQVSAVDILIADAGTVITATEVEGALQENRTAIDLNTAKVTNATHTGDVTGATALTIANDAVEEVMLKSVNTPTDEYNLTYESTTGDFEWQEGLSVSNNTNNYLLTATGTNALNGESNLYFDDVNNYLGIRTTTPEATFHIQNSSSGIIVDILKLDNPHYTNSGSRILFDNYFGNLAGIKGITSPGGGSFDNEGDLVFQTATNSVLADQVTIKYDGKVGIGTTTPAEKLDVNGNAIIRGDLTVTDTYNYAADAQADDDYEIAIPAITALVVGLTVTFKANTANTGAVTLEITSVGDIDAILKMHDQPLATGDIEANQMIVAVWDGTNWQMTSQLAQ